MFNILVVEDDKNLRKLIVTCLKKKLYNTYEATNGVEALELMDKNYIDLIITDIMMPKMDGYEFIKELRDSKFNTPILVITAKNTINDKKQGYKLGADDFMVKPIDIEELPLKVNALLKRAQATNKRKIKINDFEINYDTLTVKKGDKKYDLAKKEFYLLYKLISTPDVIFTRQELMEEIWGLENESDYRTIDVHIKRLREKLHDIDDFKIETIRGVGYKLVIKGE